MRLKNSKRALSLPMAVVLCAALVILSSSLIFIAVSSISHTSSDVNGRQAYLNVRSALDYAASYYGQIEDIDKIGTECLIMDDNNGSVAAGTVAGVTTVKTVTAKSEEDNLRSDPDALNSLRSARLDTLVSGKTTYVVATYLPTDTANPTSARLKLTAYSNYNDSFGNGTKTAHLSATYIVGGGSPKKNRVTVREIDVSTDKPGSGASAPQVITLNMKQHPDQNWSLAYYIWTFKDVSNIYSGKDTCYDTNLNSVSVNKMNNNEYNSNISLPAGPWVNDLMTGDSSKWGPPSIASLDYNSAGYSQNQFVYSDDDVNYFNLILAKKGAMINGPGGAKYLDNTQTCEMFHLWYIDPNDKNVYFEFLKPDTHYEPSPNWNGSDYIEDTVLVYVNNPKTAVHFRVKGVDNDSVQPTIPASDYPVINNVTVGGAPLSGNSYLKSGGQKDNTNIKMQYEGCGWWVANIETNDPFRADIVYKGTSYTVNVTPNSDDEAWVVALPNGAGYSIQSRLTEDNANLAIGLKTNAYVTVSAKPSNTSKVISPLLSYGAESLTSSDGRRSLLDKIFEVKALEESDYTAETYADVKKVLDEAVELYNDETFIESQPGATNEDKIAAADVKYKDKIKELDEAVDKLVSKVCDTDTFKGLANLIARADQIVKDQSQKHIYDKDAFVLFDLPTGAYRTAKDLAADFDSNPSDVTISAVTEKITALQAAIDTIEAAKLDKGNLKNKIAEIDSGNYVDNGAYTSESRDALKQELEKARSVASDTVDTTQSEIDALYDALVSAVNGLVLDTPDVDTEALTQLISEVAAMVEQPEKENCTDESYNNLSAKLEDVKNRMVSATKQEQIDAMVAELTAAKDEFYVYKPNNTNDKLNSENKIKLWFSGFTAETVENLSGYSIIGYVTGGTDDDNNIIPATDIRTDASGLSYVEIDRTVFDRVSFKAVIDGADYTSEIVKITEVPDNNLVISMGAVNAEAHTFALVQEKLTTLYIEKINFTGEIEQPLVKLNGVDCPVVNSGDEHYYEVKFISKADQKVSINTKADGSGSNIPEFAVSAGQFVVKYLTETSIKQISVEDIYKKYVEVKEPTADPYNISNAEYVFSELASPSVISNDVDEYSLNKMSTTEVFDKPIASDEILIWINLEGKGLANVPYLYVWRPSPYQEYNSGWPGTKLIKWKGNIYYTIVKNTAKNYILTKGPNDGDKLTGDMTISDGSSNPSNWKYWEITSSWTMKKSSLPTYTITVNVPMNTSDLKMVMVGGKRVRITNQSYTAIYNNRSNPKLASDHSGWIINDSIGKNLFGGNANGDNRLGYAKLSAMYDWYEYKIPVDSLNTYSFEIKGLNSSQPSTPTKQLQNVYGNVYLTLNSNTTSGGTLSDIDVYTFNPDLTQMRSDATIYFKKPASWTNLQISANGIASAINDSMMSGGENGYYYYNLSKKTPFITFTVNDGNGIRSFRTSLQGGDYILFDPEANLGNGAWDTFVPIREKLKREIVEAQSIYYGYYIVGKYNPDGTIADNGSNTYLYPEALKGKISSYIDNGSVKDSMINGYSESQARSIYDDIHAVVTAYKNLYQTLSEARSYIPGFNYPEYILKGSTRSYTAETLANLKTKYDNAKGVYLSNAASAASLNDAAKKLSAAISNMSVSSEGSIAVILYDAQNEVGKGSRIDLEYKESEGAAITKKISNIKTYNQEGFPIVFIEKDEIFEVQFFVNGTARGSKKDKMEKDSTWVFFDTITSPEWSENSVSEYKQINLDEITQENSSSKYTFKMKLDSDGEYNPMTLYFKYDVTVNLADGSSYIIKSGAYYFDKDKGDEAPLSGGEINLYSADSKAYFTNPENYGMLTVSGAKDAATLPDPWVNSSGEITTGNKLTSYPVNFTASKGSFRTQRTYTTTKQLYFRWEGNQDIIVKNNVTFAATSPSDNEPSIIMASSGTIDASSVYGKHFYLSTTQAGAEKMIVRFKTDIHIKYTEGFGKEHDFYIREGDYECRKATDTQTFIADLFDEDYWISQVNVTPIGRDGNSGGSGGGSGSSLGEPTYSNS